MENATYGGELQGTARLPTAAGVDTGASACRSTRASLIRRYARCRAATEALAAPLSREDQQLQSMPACSPTKWGQVSQFLAARRALPDDRYSTGQRPVTRALGTRRTPRRACDICEIPLRQAQHRLRSQLPGAEVRIVVGAHTDAGPAISALEDRQLLLWIGSSIGNYADVDAVQLLSQMRRFLRSDAVLVFGTDLVKDPETLQRAYDDTRGITSAFSKNLLARLNREIGARFDLEAFRHVAEWNAKGSNIEVYLEATQVQQVWVGALGRHYVFGRGERIHTETCAKYDARRVDRILRAAGFARAATLLDSQARFAVHLAGVASTERGI